MTLNPSLQARHRQRDLSAGGRSSVHHDDLPAGAAQPGPQALRGVLQGQGQPGARRGQGGGHAVRGEWGGGQGLAGRPVTKLPGLGSLRKGGTQVLKVSVTLLLVEIKPLITLFCNLDSILKHYQELDLYY